MNSSWCVVLNYCFLSSLGSILMMKTELVILLILLFLMCAFCFVKLCFMLCFMKLLNVGMKSMRVQFPRHIILWITNFSVAK